MALRESIDLAVALAKREPQYEPIAIAERKPVFVTQRVSFDVAKFEPKH